jgi:Phosphatase
MNADPMPVTERQPWRRAAYSREELAEALLAGRVAGTVTSHDRRNVRWKIERLAAGEPDLQFGLTGVDVHTSEEVLAMVGEEAGFDPDPLLRDEPVPIDPVKVLDSLEAAGARLARAASRGQPVLLATGHPVGLILLYMAVGDLLVEHGAKLLRPLEGVHWREDGRRREIRYLHGVGALSDRASAIHTHRPDAMERMLEEVRPGLVFADHGFAGAAIEAGLETVSIADINDPALVVAKRQGRTGVVVVMDDNVRPEDYWPCYQAIAAQFD